MVSKKPRIVRIARAWACARFLVWPSAALMTMDNIGDGRTPADAYARWVELNPGGASWWHRACQLARNA